MLGLKRVSDSELNCSWPAERVHSTLSAAGYVGLMVDTSGSPRTPEPAVVMDEPNLADELEAALDQLVADATEAAKRGVPAGLSSIIEVATETKTPLEIVVRMPDDTSLTVVMEPKLSALGAYEEWSFGTRWKKPSRSPTSPMSEHGRRVWTKPRPVDWLVMNPDGPLIVQSDRTVLLEVHNALADAARHALAVFAELERAPEHMHTYRITRLGLWNARAAGHSAEEILQTLEEYSKFPLPPGIAEEITETIGRYGQIEITREGETLFISCGTPAIEAEITRSQKIAELLGERDEQGRFPLAPWSRGLIKQELLKKGWPAADHAGFTEGEPHDIGLAPGEWSLRDYQTEAISRFTQSGSGVVVLPCGAGRPSSEPV